MRTNPPGEERDEGEGKKPTVVGEPGGLERRHRQTIIRKTSTNRKQHNVKAACFLANKAGMNHEPGVTLGVVYKMFSQ